TRPGATGSALSTSRRAAQPAARRVTRCPYVQGAGRFPRPKRQGLDAGSLADWLVVFGGLVISHNVAGGAQTNGADDTQQSNPFGQPGDDSSSQPGGGYFNQRGGLASAAVDHLKRPSRAPIPPDLDRGPHMQLPETHDAVTDFAVPLAWHARPSAPWARPSPCSCPKSAARSACGPCETTSTTGSRR